MGFRLAPLVVLCLVLAACGSKSSRSPATTTASSPPAAAATTTAPATTSATGPGALQAEVAAAAAGDIPDNQVFVTYSRKTFAMKFPEGWAQSASGNTVIFRNKNNIVRVVIAKGARPSTATVGTELARLRAAKVTTAPSTVKLGALSAVKAVYETTSAPNSVTGKRVTLSVDRYELAKGGTRATVDLGSPAGVDNVDAYRLMIQSLRIK